MKQSHGGTRAGSGRPKGQGKYGEPTKSMRIPLSRINAVQMLLTEQSRLSLPLYSSKIQAGFPSPADDYIERYLDLNQHLIQHPSATFILTASGESMTGAGIHPGDMLLVDKSIEAVDGSIVIAALDGELTVKRLSRKAGCVQLLPENPAFKPIDITEEQDLHIWGVVTYVIHVPT
jgi:DNA polymerase V